MRLAERMERMGDWRNPWDVGLKETGSHFYLEGEMEELYLNTNHLFIHLMAVY